jgi:hypothetical protein
MKSYMIYKKYFSFTTLTILLFITSGIKAQKPLILSGYPGGKYCELLLFYDSLKISSAYIFNHFDYLKTEFIPEEKNDFFLDLSPIKNNGKILSVKLLRNSLNMSYKGYYYAEDGHIGHVEFKPKENTGYKDDNQYFIDINLLFRQVSFDFGLSNYVNTNLFNFDLQTMAYFLNEDIFNEQQLKPEIQSLEKNFFSIHLTQNTDSIQKYIQKIHFIKIDQFFGEGYLVLFEQKKTFFNNEGKIQEENEILTGYFEKGTDKNSVQWNNLSNNVIFLSTEVDSSLTKSKFNILKNDNFLTLNLDFKYTTVMNSNSIIIENEEKKENGISVIFKFTKDGKIHVSGK